MESNAVGQVVRGLERTIKPAENKKLGLTKQNLHHFLHFLLTNGIEEASFHLKCGLQRLKNQRLDHDVSIVCVAEFEKDPLLTVKLIKRLVIMRVKDNGAQEDDVLFPALRGKAVEKRAVSYSVVSSVFKSMLLGLGWSLQEARSFGLHSFRIGAITAGVESGALTEDQLRRAGR